MLALHTRLHQTIHALHQAWRDASPSTIARHPMLLARSVAILKALQKYTTHHPAQTALQRALKQLEKLIALSETPPSLLAAPPSTHYVPWFRANFPYPANHADLALDPEWKKQLKAYRDRPYQRLELALSKLPYRLAYQEAILALRTIIRTEPNNRSQALTLLYWLAASATFLKTGAHTPAGDQIIAALKGKSLQQLPLDYLQLGTQHLDLLNLTDIKNLEQVFGSSLQHRSPSQVHLKLWQAYQQQLPHATP